MEGLHKLRMAVQKLAARRVGIDYHSPKHTYAQKQQFFKCHELSSLPTLPGNEITLQVQHGSMAGTPYYMVDYDPLDSGFPMGPNDP